MNSYINPRLENLQQVLSDQDRLCTCDCGKPKLPKFSSHHIAEISELQTQNTKILRNRFSIFETLNKKNTPLNIMEIGVLAGDFARSMLDCLNINKIYLIDPFNINDGAAQNIEPRFTKENHYEFILNRFKDDSRVEIRKGLSEFELTKLLDLCERDKMDFIYIDSDHRFENLYNEILYSTQILKQDGIIGIDDMSLFLEDPVDMCEVFQAVTRFLANNLDWEVSYYSFHDNGIPNIYLSRMF